VELGPSRSPSTHDAPFALDGTLELYERENGHRCFEPGKTSSGGRARELGGGAAVAGTAPSKARPPLPPLRARCSLLQQLASCRSPLCCHVSPRRRGCAALERRGPRDGRAGAARTSSPPPPSPCGRTSRRARPQRAAQGGAPVGAAVWPSTAASSSRRARRRPWASVAAATARAAAAGVGAAAGVRAAASAPLQWPWRPAEGATRGAAWIACISAKKIAVNRGV